jgi:endonuclease III-like uncharacterized protein
LTERYSSAKTTKDFLKLIQELGVEPLLNFKGKKSRLAQELATFFDEQSVQTEDDLREWLLIPDNAPRLKRIKGIGNKTVDYLGLLVGLQTIAVDRHTMNFLAEADIQVSGYKDVHQVVSQTAEILTISSIMLDQSIWRYMSDG